MHLRLEGVTSTWPGFTLEDITIEIGDRQYFALLGPTGSGKTLLLETMMGFHRLRGGRILADDRDISMLPPGQRGFGYVPQSGVLFPHLSVRQNIEFGLSTMKIDQAARRRASDEVMGELSITHLERRQIQNLSAGERQKVALARVLVMKPRLMLLDEPLSSIDTEARRDLRNLLKRLHSESGSSFIHVTHDQLEALSLADSVAIMKGGRITQKGSTAAVFSNPESEFVARFLGYENILVPDSFRIDGDIIRLTLNGKELLCSRRGYFPEAGRGSSGGGKFAVRPDHVTVSKRPTEFPNCILGKITDFVDLGLLVELTLDVGFTLKSIITKDAFMDNALHDKDAVWVSLRPGSLVSLNG